MDTIQKFKEKLVKNNVKGLALDIDETLSWTIGYWVEQLQKKFGNPENLTVHELITKYRYSHHVPYWQTREAITWMDEHRNSNEIQTLLPLIENANHIVEKINAIIPIVAYITTRPERVIEGSKQWLKKHNFPPVDIIARPPEIHLADGNKWKAKVLEKLYPSVIGIIDDNPGLPTFLSSAYKGTVFLYDNIEHPRKDILVIPCKTWSRVLQKVEEAYTVC